MEKLLKSLYGFGGSILFVLLGIYILRTNTTLLGKIIGIACIMFFGGLAIFGACKMSRDSNQK